MSSYNNQIYDIILLIIRGYFINFICIFIWRWKL